MADGKEQVEKTIELCREVVEKLDSLAGSGEAQAGDAKKRVSDMLYALEGIRNKIFFKTKNSLSFTMPTLSAAERVQEALEDLSQGNVDFDAVLNEIDSLESNVDILKVKVASQDIIIT